MKVICDLSLTSAPHRPRAAWSPGALFRSGEPGAWYDPSDLGTLYQDSAGTMPVTAGGQPVGLMLDKSGRGRHLSQSVSAARPTYQVAGGLARIAFDGVDDFMVSSAIDLTGTDKATVFAGVLAESNAAQGIICELSVNMTSNAGAAWIVRGNGQVAAAAFAAASRGTAAAFAGQVAASAATFPAPATAVLTASHDIAGDLSTLRVNGAASGSSGTTDKGAGNFGNYPMYLGRRGGVSLPFQGSLFGLILRGVASSAAEIARAERFMATKTGVTL